VEEDPRFAPAWARLGRIHHVIGKYVDTGADTTLEQAEAAVRRALDLNPDLAMAHKLLAQLDVDRGRSQQAMTRLIERGSGADPEVFAGLVSAAAIAGCSTRRLPLTPAPWRSSQRFARASPHTWFVQGDHSRVAAIDRTGFTYIFSISAAELGRGAEMVALAPRCPRAEDSGALHDLMLARYGRDASKGNRSDQSLRPSSGWRLLRLPGSGKEVLFYLRGQSCSPSGGTGSGEICTARTGPSTSTVEFFLQPAFRARPRLGFGWGKGKGKKAGLPRGTRTRASAARGRRFDSVHATRRRPR
jgi:hypothetical protein